MDNENNPPKHPGRGRGRGRGTGRSTAPPRGRPQQNENMSTTTTTSSSSTTQRPRSAMRGTRPANQIQRSLQFSEQVQSRGYNVGTGEMNEAETGALVNKSNLPKSNIISAAQGVKLNVAQQRNINHLAEVISDQFRILQRSTPTLLSSSSSFSSMNEEDLYGLDDLNKLHDVFFKLKTIIPGPILFQFENLLIEVFKYFTNKFKNNDTFESEGLYKSKDVILQKLVNLHTWLMVRSKTIFDQDKNLQQQLYQIQNKINNIKTNDTRKEQLRLQYIFLAHEFESTQPIVRRFQSFSPILYELGEAYNAYMFNE